ncbi:hypothetical protein [Vibrio lentus]|uniref:hypothetical protein n=1 Tax=Vibrio lentus TaxID=136468 RepID=UPI000C8581CE|nr:hypothetical protein [Vibrio lentus]PMM22420.1 hypothetical protein BCT58_16515 [Vibrio lentus]
MPRNIPISKFADFILFYKINGKVKQKKFEDTEAKNVYRYARSFPQGIAWKIRQLPSQQQV